ncbi:MAG: hypothetical protein RIQ93_946 [Verrucomicrobiota bacterium]|jgi:hypothetical protein
MIRNSLQGFLDALGNQAGTRFVLEENGSATIRCDNQAEIVVESHDVMQLIFVHAPVLALAGIGNRAAIFEHALELGLFSLGTGGGVIGYDRKADQLVLSFSSPVAALDGQSFVNLFANFITVLGRVRAALASAHPDTAPRDESKIGELPPPPQALPESLAGICPTLQPGRIRA